MRRFQRRNRSGLTRERWMMAAGSALVLGVLTLTGVYIRDLSNRSFEGYIVDLTTLEEWDAKNNNFWQDNLDDPFSQQASGSRVDNPQSAVNLPSEIKEQIGGPDPDLIAFTNNIMEGITSSDLEIGELILATEEKPELNRPGQTDELRNESRASLRDRPRSSPIPTPVPPDPSPPAEPVVPAISTALQTTLSFREGDNLVWPIVGNVLINFSMDKSVYFPTLKHYRYNPAIIIQAKEGDIVSAAAAGKVTSVYRDTQIGNAITIDLGSGFEITYGQLKNILVSEGSFVAAGDIVAEVAAPTKYYSVEGTNIYFKLTKDGVPVNPLSKLN